jgi:ABC-2 type transport system permease protein
MAVYKKTYRGYEGGFTNAWSRFLVIPRYALEDLHRRRFLVTFFVASFLYPLIAALIIYVEHNLSALKLMNLERASQLITIDSGFFLNVLGVQSMLCFFMAAFVGPGQVSPDLTNNGLSLYLARPFSRAEYVLGKSTVLLALMSLMTWIPGLLLFGLQSYLEGWAWMTANTRIAAGLFLGSWIWILLLTLLALALSAWVKWKPAAGGLMFGTFFVSAAFGAAINGVQRSRWGHLLNISHMVGSVWLSLFEGKVEGGGGAVFFRVPQGEEIPIWCCWIALMVMTGICLYMLHRKIRGAEVVR